jgi:DNA-binding response OmpR family regulator
LAGESKVVNVVSRVLLIDDNPVQLGVREAVLRKAGFQVSVATTTESALATLRALGEGIGVVVTDHLMPASSGSELVRTIRAENKCIPVIVLSGLSDAEVEYRGLDVVFRIKPLAPEDLIELVRTSLEEGARQRGAA